MTAVAFPDIINGGSHYVWIDLASSLPIFAQGCFVLRPILSEEVFVWGHLDVVTSVGSDALFMYAAQKGSRSWQFPGRSRFQNINRTS